MGYEYVSVAPGGKEDNKGVINMKVFAILHEPASYTIDRNRTVYDPMGVQYAYMHRNSFAVADSDEVDNECLPSSLFALIRRLKTILRENDVVIMNGYTNIVFVILFILNIFYHKEIGIDSDTQLAIPNSLAKRCLKYLYLRLVFGNRQVYGLAGGNGSHKELFLHYGMNKSRVFLMPMMVNNEKYYCSTKEPHDAFTFLYVGRLVECKNLKVLFDAFVSRFANDAATRLVVVGEGDMSAQYKSQYENSNNIIFVGKQSGGKLVAYYHDADALVLPSSYEPWGLVVNEAMSAGLPVIVSDRVGAAQDLVDGRETGFVFHYDDVDDLAEKMAILRDDAALRQRMSSNAYHLMHDYWNYDLYTNCLKEFIEYVKDKRHC